MILDIPNNFFNMQEEQLKGYFKNLARMSGASRLCAGSGKRSDRCINLTEWGILEASQIQRGENEWKIPVLSAMSASAATMWRAASVTCRRSR